ncbi:TetR/AcrR family transcriptional regulator [Paenarthrobacter aurescens]|uniref:TetR/AcrR family transcriptional regulator n=1 Tax=Paenarthrobacter aurescens TaxID=43663 RepID=UPI0035E483F0
MRPPAAKVTSVSRWVLRRPLTLYFWKHYAPTESYILKLQPARPAHRPSRRSALLAAALELFAAADPSDVPMDVVATHAKMTTAAVYYHFASKTDLIESLMSGVTDKLAEFFSLASGPSDLGTWGLQSMRRALVWMQTNPLEAKFFFVRLATTHDGAETLVQFRRDSATLVESIADSIVLLDSSIDPLEAAIMARALMTLVSETAKTTLTSRDAVPRNFRTYQEAASIVTLRILGR